MEKDIVVDTTIIRLYGGASDPVFKKFFSWLFSKGVLACSQMLLSEYKRIGSNAVASLIDHLIRNRRFRRYERTKVDAIRAKHFRYGCNYDDKCHVRLVMCTQRRLCLSQDRRLVRDVNCFPGYRARAARRPNELKYE